MTIRIFFLGFLCLILSFICNGQELQWLIDPEDFLPPGDITMSYNNSSCTDEFADCMWSGKLEGESFFQTWEWELIPDVHFSYQLDCLYEIVYDFLPCEDAIDIIEDDNLASGGELVEVAPNSLITTTVCVTVIDVCNDDPDLEYCFDVTIQCGDCGINNNILCSTCEDASIPQSQGGCKLCDPIDLAEGYSSCTPPCGWPNCPIQEAPQPQILCNIQGVPNNMSWFAFVANSENIDVHIEVFNCIGDGVQSGIYTGCDYEDCVGFSFDCANAQDVEFSANFEVGQTYYLFVDGCSGSECEYTVYAEGLSEVILDDMDAITAVSLCSDEVLTDDFSSGAGNDSVSGACTVADVITVCPGDVIQFNAIHQGNYGHFPGYDAACDNYPPGLDAYFQWSSSWGETWEYNPSEENPNEIIPPVGMPPEEGMYSICLDFIDYECYPVVGPVCLDINVTSGLSHEYFVDNDGDGYGTGDPVLFTCPAPAGYACLDGDCDDNDPNIIGLDVPPSPRLTCGTNGSDAVIISWEENSMFDYELDLTLMPANLVTEIVGPGEMEITGFISPCQYAVLGIEVTNPAAPQCGLTEERIPCRPSPRPTILFDFPTEIEACDRGNDSIYLNVIVDGTFNPSSGMWQDASQGAFISRGSLAILSPNELVVGSFTHTYEYTNPIDGCVEIASASYTIVDCIGVDNDGDGFSSIDDCNDNDPDIFPGNPEICDGKDNNCDGNIDEGFAKTTAILSCGIITNSEVTIIWDEVPGAIAYQVCIDGSVVVAQSNTNYTVTGLAPGDLVELGVIVSYSDQCKSEKTLISCTTTNLIDNDGDGSPAGVDCDDTDPRNFPGNFEVCDGRDNNCDGIIDEGFGNVELMISCVSATSTEITVEWNLINAAQIYYVYEDNNFVGSSTTNSYTITGLNPSEQVDIRVDVLFSNGCPQQSITINCATGSATDNDGDGSPAGTDCDDNDPNNFPGNPEVCDGKDNNCNGMIDEGIATEQAVISCIGITNSSLDFSWEMVTGATGYVICIDGVPQLTQVENTFSVTGLGQGETIVLGVIVAYGMDCESEKSFSTCTTTNLIDNDGDGSPAGTDCDDNDANNYPGNTETCDGADNNCDGQIDEGLVFVTYYSDNDRDGYGVDGTGFEECLQPPDTTTEAGDCDDNDPDVNPGAMEIPNNTVDENCDGVAEIIDLDGDGWNSDLDCDDTNAAINPGAIEVPGNGIDEDCDGEDGGVAVHELDGKQISLFPNPVTDKLYIEADLKGLAYSIHSVDGAIIKAGKLKSRTIDFGSLASGIYFISIRNDNNNNDVVERIVKL